MDLLIDSEEGMEYVIAFLFVSRLMDRPLESHFKVAV